MVGAQRRIVLDILMVFWGYGTWLGVNGAFVQLPLLVERLPEGWALGSFVTVAVQLGNSGLIVYALLRRLLPRAPDVVYIYILLVILTTSFYLNSFLYTETAVIGGSERSVAFLSLTFGFALVGCTSSVLFYPYLRHFRDIYLATYLVGEGLSGLLPSLLALVQGVGGDPECIFSSDNKTVVAVFPPPRFDTTIFFVILGSLGLLSLVSFAFIDNFKSFLSERVQTSEDEKEKEATPESSVVWQKPFISVLFLMACLNAIMNGVLPSMQSYSCMPYGRNIYHLAATLGAMANPAACMAGIWLKPAPTRLLAGMLFVILLPLCYILSTAVLSPTPPLHTVVGGKVLIVLAWVSVFGVLSYARMRVYEFARRGGGTGMRVCGAVGQVGSVLGSLTTFLIVNFEDIIKIFERGVEVGLRLRVFSRLDQPPTLPPYRDYREGVLLDVRCDNASAVLHEASTNRAFNLRHSWLLVDDSPMNTTHLDIALADVRILPDGDVTWASSDQIVDVYKIRADQPLVVLGLGLRKSQRELEILWRSLPTAVTRRKDLRNVYLNSATIVTQPQYFKGWSDLSNRQIDTFPKLTYPILMLCGEDLNFRFNLKQVDLYGEERNGTFDGLVGRMQRGELEVGVTSMFMRKDRWRVLHYCAETVELKGAFLFRQPSRSAVSNVFALPFSRGVWAAAAAVFASAGALLALAGAVARARALDPAADRLTLAESFTYAVGTICQQGSDLTPRLLSVRLLMFCTLMAALFAFTSYSAKIVAILQAPSEALRTIADLGRSPMDLGVQETTYKRVYFAESKDPATQALYRRKLLPLGDRAYLSVVDGIARVRTGLFAFQVEQSSAYDIISKTYTEREKCGLKEIKAFTLPMVAVPVRKHSGYRDLLGARLRWQREVGLMDRHRRVWMSARTQCDAGGGGFASVGLVDVLPALHALLAGALLALGALLLERCRKTRLPRLRRRQGRHGYS